MKRLVLLLIFIFTTTSCFDSGSSDEDGGGLFNNHKNATNKFFIYLPNSKTYNEGNKLNIVLSHPFAVDVVGTPRLAIDMGGSTVYADYYMGSGSNALIFSYTIAAGDNDLDGIEIAPTVDLNGGTLKFTSKGVVKDANTTLGGFDSSNILVDTTAPSIISIIPTVPQIYYLNETLQFIINFDSDVVVDGTPQIQMDFGGSTVYANYISGSGTDTLLFQKQVNATDLDLDGINLVSPLNLNGGTLKDEGGNSADLTYTVSLPTQAILDLTFVDGDTPYVTNIVPPANDTYLPGETLSMTLSFSEVVNVTGTPHIDTTIGLGVIPFEYQSGSGTSILTFTYTVSNGDVDLDGISIPTSFNLNGGTIRDGSLNNAVTTFSAPMTPNVLVDGTIPEVQNINIPADGVYLAGQQLTFILEYDIPVYITGAQNPKLPIDIGGNIVEAEYFIGSGSTNITYTYNIGATDVDTNGITIGATLNNNTASIKSNTGIDANPDLVPALASIDTSNIFVGFQGPFIDAAITVPGNGNYLTTQNIDINVSFDQLVNVTGSPRIVLDVGGIARYATYLSGSGSSDLIFRYTVGAADSDNDGIQISSNLIDLAGGTILDGSSNAANLDLTKTAPLPNTAGILVNDIVATQLVITQEPSDTYANFNITPAITVELRDASNVLASGATNNVTVAIATDPSAGAATLSGTTTVAAIGGVATFSDLNLDDIQNGYTLIFTSAGLTSATSIGFNITQAPATQLAFIQNPSDAIAGVNIVPSITVEVQDAIGNIVSSATDNITLSLGTDPSAGSATLGGTLTVAAVSGVATFSDINLDKAFLGYTLDASATGLTSSTSSTFNIAPSTKSQLVFSVEPTNAEANVAISPSIEVEIQDAYGNKTTDTDNITLAINNNPSAGTLSGTLTQAAVNGTAVFNDININNLGVGYTLDATSGGLTLATSAAFNISATPTQLIITQEPSDSGISADIAPAITVELRDATNALVTDATNNVTVAIDTDPSGGAATLSGTLTVAAVAGIATFSDLQIDNEQNGYTLRFTSASLADAVSATFNISEEAPVVEFATTTSSRSEAEGTINILVDKPQTNTSSVTVPYTVTGTATGGGTDHNLADGNIVFNPGETNKNISFSVIDDFVVDNNETVIVTLGTPSLGTLGTNTVHTVTITEPPLPNFSMCNTLSSNFASGLLYDSGGKSTNYSDNESCSFLIQPNGATFVTIGPSSFATNSASDVLTIYDGTDNTGTLLGTFSVASFVTPVTATSGSMYIEWNTDASTTAAGYELKWISDGDVALSLSSTSIDVGDSINLYAFGGQGPYTFSITNGGGTLSGSSYTADGGPGSVVLRVTDANSDFDEKTLTVVDTTTLPYYKMCTISGATTPTGNLEDSGGNGYYYNNENCSFLIAPTGATEVTLSPVMFNTRQSTDFLRIYDGTDNTGTLMGTYALQDFTNPIIGSSGALYLEWITDGGSTYPGFELEWTSNAPLQLGISSNSTEINDTVNLAALGGTPPYTYSIVSGLGSISGATFTASSESGEVIVRVTDGDSNTDDKPIQVIDTSGIPNVKMCSAGTVTSPTARIYDSGGASGYYYNNENCSILIQPTGAGTVELSSIAFNTRNVNDYLRVYDGTDNTGTLLGHYFERDFTAPVIANSGSMYLEWVSDGGSTYPGFELIYSSDAPVDLAASENTVEVGNNITLSVVGGVAPYTYSIVSGGGTLVGNTYTAPNLTGEAVLRVTDSLSNTSDETITIIDTSIFPIKKMCQATSSTEPDGRITDSGGATEYYQNNENCGFLIQPTGAGFVQLSATSFNTRNPNDYLNIYDGTDNTGTLLGKFFYQDFTTAVTALSGSMYLEWVTDGGSTYPGFDMFWTSDAPLDLGLSATSVAAGGTVDLSGLGGQAPYTYSIVSGNGSITDATFTAGTESETVTLRVTDSLSATKDKDVTIVATPTLTGQQMCFNTSSTDPTGRILDSGGPVEYYQNNENCSYLIQPAGATVIELNASYFNTRNSNDYLNVYDGTDNTGTYLGKYYGQDFTTSITATSGAMYLEWVTDGGSTYPGFDLYWTSDAPLKLALSNTTLEGGATLDMSGLGGQSPYSYSIVSGGGSITDATFTAPTSSGTVTLRVTDALLNTDDKVVTIVDTATVPNLKLCNELSSTDPGGRLFDSGGEAGYYYNNESCSFLIQPTGATTVELNKIYFNTRNSNDYITIYDGTDNTGTNLGTYFGQNFPTSLTATSGAIFIEWVTDGGSTYPGLELVWTSDAALKLNAELNTIYTGDSVNLAALGGNPGYTYSLVSGVGSVSGNTYTADGGPGSALVRVTDGLSATSDQIIEVLDTNTVHIHSMCNDLLSNKGVGRIFDTGSSTGYYFSNESCSFLIAPTGATEVKVSLYYFRTRDANDWLKVYDGTDNTGTLLGTFFGADAPPTITVPSGNVFLEWETNGSSTYPGFDIAWTSDTALDLGISAYSVDLGSTVDMAAIFGGGSYTYSIVSGGGSITNETYTAPGTTDLVTIRVDDGGTTSDKVISVLDVGAMVTQTMCTDTSSTDTSGYLVDSGGAGGNYSSNEDCGFLIQPGGANNIYLSAEFFDTRDYADWIEIYDGTDDTGTLLGHFPYRDFQAPVKATSGAMYIKWHSNGSSTDPGFRLLWDSD